MNYKKIYKYLFTSGLAALFLGATVLAGCSEEDEKAGEVSTSFFNIGVSVENFGSTARAVEEEMRPDTIITPVDDNLYMETIVTYDDVQTGSARATTGLESVPLTNTAVTILAYNATDPTRVIGTIHGTVQAGGSVSVDSSVSASGGALSLTPGDYIFICVANADQINTDPNETDEELKNTAKFTMGQNGMWAKTTVTIQPSTTSCSLNFNLEHMMGIMRIKVKAEGSNFSGFSGTLKCGYTTLKSCGFALLDVQMKKYYAAGEAGVNDEYFNNINSSEAMAENYYVPWSYGAYGEPFFEVTSGSIGATSLVGKQVKYPTAGENVVKVVKNKITTVNITFKQMNCTVNFVTSEGGTVSSPSASGVEGSAVSCTATPSANYLFDYWKDNNTGVEAGRDAALNLTLSKSIDQHTFTAYFKLKPTSLEINPSEHRVGAARCAVTSTVTCNTNWTCVNNASWIEYGTTTDRLTMIVDANTTSTARTGTVIVTAGSVSRTVTVIQEAAQGYQVSYNANGGTYTPSNASYLAGATVTAASAISRTGYTFAGWQRSDNGAIVGGNGTFAMPAANVTLTAQWTATAPIKSSFKGTVTNCSGVRVTGGGRWICLNNAVYGEYTAITPTFNNVEIAGSKFYGANGTAVTVQPGTYVVKLNGSFGLGGGAAGGVVYLASARDMYFQALGGPLGMLDICAYFKWHSGNSGGATLKDAFSGSTVVTFTSATTIRCDAQIVGQNQPWGWTTGTLNIYSMEITEQ